jgi:hypothetical protein
MRPPLAATGAAQYQARTDRNQDYLAELLAWVADDPETTAAITAAWQDVQRQPSWKVMGSTSPSPSVKSGTVHAEIRAVEPSTSRPPTLARRTP